MKSLIINIHSFVDFISNSSSEVFISADQKTIDTLKSLVNNILQIGGSQLKCDDLFEFKLVVEDDNDWKNTKFVEVNSEEGQKVIKEGTDNHCGYGTEIEVKVIAKDKNGEVAAKRHERCFKFADQEKRGLQAICAFHTSGEDGRMV